MRTHSKQWRASSVLAVLVGVGMLGQARAGVVTYTDRTAFLNAFPQADLIDFETLPDGSPSYSHAEIKPTFNYTDQGVDFSAHLGVPFITGSEVSGFTLTAGPQFSSDGPPNWLIVDFATPARALGFTFGGDTTLSLFTPDNEFLGTWLWGGGGEFFLGAASDDRLIASAIINAGLERQTIGDFYVIPVPEPGSLALLAFG